MWKLHKVLVIFQTMTFACLHEQNGQENFGNRFLIKPRNLQRNAIHITSAYMALNDSLSISMSMLFPAEHLGK